VSISRAVRIVLTLSVALALAGCASESLPEPDLAAQPQAMTLEQREALPPGFPIEIPALAGEVAVAETLGEQADVGPWHYEVTTDAELDALVQWYKDVYAGRSWRLVSEAEEPDGHALVFTKGAGAWSTVHLVVSGEAVSAECWAGIGVPVPPEAVPPSVQEGLDV